MSNAKRRCKYLKGVRKRLADKLGIDLRQRECTFEGECTGTCPKCRAEEEQLNAALLAKRVAVVTAAAAAIAGLSGCRQEELVNGMLELPPEPREPEIEELAGDVPAPIEEYSAPAGDDENRNGTDGDIEELGGKVAMPIEPTAGVLPPEGHDEGFDYDNGGEADTDEGDGEDAEEFEELMGEPVEYAE